jgi:rubrerythrin
MGSVAALRATNLVRCEHLVARSALLETADLDWSTAGDVELDDDAIAALVYMRDVEGFTNRDLVGLTAHPATHRDPLMVRFLDAWRAEEAEHARAVDRFLTAYADQRQVEIPPMQLPPPAVVPTSERLLVAATRPIGHVVTAAHMVWGAANELLTMHGYRLLAARCGNPLLQELLGRIAAQEARHYSFYKLQAEWRLADSRVARVAVRTMLRRAWTPVGVGDGYKAPSEFRRLLDYLGSGAAGRRAVTVMDAAFSSLPGLADLGIFHRVALAA